MRWCCGSRIRGKEEGSNEKDLKVINETLYDRPFGYLHVFALMVYYIKNRIQSNKKVMSPNDKKMSVNITQLHFIFKISGSKKLRRAQILLRNETTRFFRVMFTYITLFRCC